MQSSQVSTDSNINTSANRSVEKVGDGKYSSHSLDEVSGMIRSTISAYESKLSSSNFLRSSGSTRRPAVSTNRDQMIVGSEIDSSRARNTDASPGALRKISSSAAAQRSSLVLSADHKRVASSRNSSNIKNLESTLKGIEGLHFNSNERQHY